MVLLRDMTDDEYAAYMDVTVPAYAKEGARALGLPMDEALVIAREQLDGLLPQGPRTQGQFFQIVESSPGQRVGVLWTALREKDGLRDLFIYDIVIEDAARGCGHGSAAMRALETEARKHGCTRVALHVFSHNEGAIRLYERLGYDTLSDREGGRQMAFELGEEGRGGGDEVG